MTQKYHADNDEYFVPPKPVPFQTTPIAAYANSPSPQWIIKNVLPAAELAVIYGESGCGKTFMALDLVFSIARGFNWQNNRTKKGRVVYICAEGANGFRRRLLAYGLHHNVNLNEIDNFDVIGDAPNFMSPQDAPLLIEAIGKADVIVVDTFMRIMPGGNENSGEHVGYVIAQCKLLHQETGAIIILIHHSGKVTDQGARGWSGLKGAADMEIEILKIGDAHKGRISKQKDGDDRYEWGFTLKSVHLGFDEDGDDITSCIYEQTPDTPLAENKSAKSRDHGGNEKRIIKAFKEIGGIYISVDVLINHAMKNMAWDKDGRDTRKQVLIRAIDTLESNNFLINNNGIISLM